MSWRLQSWNFCLKSCGYGMPMGWHYAPYATGHPPLRDLCECAEVVVHHGIAARNAKSEIGKRRDTNICVHGFVPCRQGRKLMPPLDWQVLARGVKPAVEFETIVIPLWYKLGIFFDYRRINRKIFQKNVFLDYSHDKFNLGLMVKKVNLETFKFCHLNFWFQIPGIFQVYT